jgi:hypothetical protein
MHNRAKDIVLRKLTNEAISEFNGEEIAVCQELCGLIATKYLSDKDLIRRFLKIIQKS